MTDQQKELALLAEEFEDCRRRSKPAIRRAGSISSS